MENRILKVTLESLGTITRLPDSQTIFGALIWNFVQKEQLQIVEDIFNLPVEIKVSNMMPKDFMPNMYSWHKEETFQLSYYLKRNSEKVTTFIFDNDAYKNSKRTYKDRKWVACNECSDIELQEVTSFRTMNNVQQVQDRSGGVFSQNYTEFFRVENDSKKKNSSFVFYLELQEEYADVIENMLKNQVLRLGKRSSRGMNIFEVESVEQIIVMKQGTNQLFNIGMLGLNNIEHINVEKSKLKHYISERCGYNDWTSRHVIKYIDMGSLITLMDGICSQEIINYHRLEEKRYLYTGGFLFPVNEVKCK